MPTTGKDRSEHERARGKSKVKSLSHISRHAPDDKELDAAVQEFQGGSDRVAAIMGAALVENSLMSVIGVALVDNFSDNALFHDQGAPFGTFRARIIAGRALGLFNEQVATELDIVRDIRNQFAHALLSIDFEHEDIAARCGQLTDHFLFDDEGTKINLHANADRKVGETRLKFEAACWALSIILIQKERKLLEEKTAKLEAELERLKNPPPRNALAGFVAASIERGGEDIKNDIATDKA
jgi:hypothetical protein